jgi:hypothetical protein
VRVAIIGDIVHSRVARSNIYLLSKYGARIVLCGPASLLPSEMRQIAAAETSPPFDDFPLAILDKGSEIDLSVGTPKGLFQGAYLPASHSPVTWLFSGPSSNCGNVNGVPTFCGPKITALALDPVHGTLYFSYIPHESWPSGDDGAVESLPVGSLNATVVSLIPWITDLALVDVTMPGGGLEAACKIGVYLHGMAGDLAEADEGEIAMTAGDVAAHLGDAIMELTARRKVVNRQQE